MDSPVAQLVNIPPAMQETRVQSLCWEDPLEKEMAIYSSVLAWRIPWTKEPGELQSVKLQKIKHNWATNTTLLTAPRSTLHSALHRVGTKCMWVNSRATALFFNKQTLEKRKGDLNWMTIWILLLLLALVMTLHNIYQYFRSYYMRWVKTDLNSHNGVNQLYFNKKVETEADQWKYSFHFIYNLNLLVATF